MEEKLILALLFLPAVVIGQNKATLDSIARKPDKKRYVQQMPEFPGGQVALKYRLPLN